MALVPNGGHRAMAWVNDGLVRQVHQFCAERLHNLLHRASPQVSAPDAASKKRVAGKELWRVTSNLFGCMWRHNFLGVIASNCFVQKILDGDFVAGLIFNADFLLGRGRN